MAPLRPRAFISYRHTEHEAMGDVDSASARHRQWVMQFAADLRASGVDVVYDQDLRDVFATRSTKDPWMIEFLGEASSLCPLLCHAFIPILTPSYIERLGYGGYQNQSSSAWSFVQEEWQIAIGFVNGGVMQYIPVIRAGDRDRMAALPLGLGPDNAFDMTDPQHNRLQASFIAQRMLEAWDGDDPLLRATLPEFIDIYISWCREQDPKRAVTPVEEWRADIVYTRGFLDALMKKHL